MLGGRMAVKYGCHWLCRAKPNRSTGKLWHPKIICHCPPVPPTRRDRSLREDMLDVPARADLPIRRLGPPEAAIAAPIVPVPQQAVLTIDIVD
jgi:hypothetical protein